MAADVLVQPLQGVAQLAQRRRSVRVLFVAARGQQPRGQVDRHHLVQAEGRPGQVGVLVHQQPLAAIFRLIDAGRQLAGVQILGDGRAIDIQPARDLSTGQAFGMRPQQLLDL